jgi:hypothetical protein
MLRRRWWASASLASRYPSAASTPLDQYFETFFN